MRCYLSNDFANSEEWLLNETPITRIDAGQNDQRRF